MVRTVVSDGVTFQIDAEIGWDPETNASVRNLDEDLGYITTGVERTNIPAFMLESPLMVFSGAVTPTAGDPGEIAKWQLGIAQNVVTYDRVARYTNGWILTDAFQTGDPRWNPAPPPLRDGEPATLPFYQGGAALTLNEQTEIEQQDSNDDPRWLIPVSMSDGSTFETSYGDNRLATWLMLARVVDPPGLRKIILLGRIRWRVVWLTTMHSGRPMFLRPVTTILDVVTHQAQVLTAANLPDLEDGDVIPDLRRTASNAYVLGTMNQGNIRVWSYDDEGGAIPFEQPEDPNRLANWLSEPPEAVLQERALRTVQLADVRPPGAASKQAARRARSKDADPDAAADQEGTVFDIEVPANVVWVDTGLIVDSDLPVSLRVTSGSWTANPATGMVGPAGHAELIAKPGYALPSAPEGLLVGQIGASVFPIGDGVVVPSSLTGRLYLSINDDMSGEYGAGFTDNEGAMQVEITVGTVDDTTSAVAEGSLSPITNAASQARVPPIGARLR